MSDDDQTCEHVTPYDVEEAVRVMTRARRRREPIVLETLKMADRMTAELAAVVPTEAHETVGLAMLRVSSMGAALIRGEDLQLAPEAVTLAETLLNVQAFAGERLVRDARAIDAAGL